MLIKLRIKPPESVSFLTSVCFLKNYRVDLCFIFSHSLNKGLMEKKLISINKNTERSPTILQKYNFVSKQFNVSEKKYKSNSTQICGLSGI